MPLHQERINDCYPHLKESVTETRFLKKRFNLKILAIAPIFGWTGDAINERQLIFSLANYVNRIYVISLVGGGIISAKKVYFKVKPPKNVYVIPIVYPIFPYPLISLMQVIALSVFLAPFIAILKQLGVIDAIYIRGSIEAAGLMTNHKIASCSIVKTVFFPEDEIPNQIQSRFMKTFIQTFIKKVDRYALERCGKIAVPNVSFAEELIRRRNLQKSKPLIITPPGIDLRLIKSIRSEERYGGENVRIGFVGKFSSYQGIDVLIRAMQRVQKVFPKAVLFLIGSYPSLHSSEYQKMKLLIENLTVKTKIIGVVPHEDALKFLSSFNMLVVPRRRFSSTELNLPIKVLEAFALGVPVVMTKHAICDEVFRGNEAVLFVEPDPKDVASKIMLLLSDEKLRARLQKNGRILVERFNYASIAYNLASALQELVRQSG